MKDSKGFSYARKAARKSDFNKIHIGCAAIYLNSIIALGWNVKKTHPLQMKYNSYRNFEGANELSRMHAEMMVIQKIRHLDINFSKVKIYIYRSSKGKLMLCRPCPACEKAFRDLGIKKIYYTGYDSYIAERYI